MFVRNLALAALAATATGAWTPARAAEPPHGPDLNELLRTAKPAPQPRPEWRRTPIGVPPVKNLGMEKDIESGAVRTVPVDVLRALQTPRGRVDGFPVEAAPSGTEPSPSEGPAAATGSAQPRQVEATPPSPSYYVRDFPWNTIVKLLMRFGSYWYVCTGDGFDGFHLLTAGHCVYNFDPNDDGDTSDQQWADEIWAFPAQTDLVGPFGEADHPYGEAYVTYMRSWSCWTVDADWDCDFGFLTLDRSLGDRIGWMGRGWGIEEPNLNFSGYPVETPYVPPNTLVQYPGYDPGNAHDYTDYRIPMYAYTYGGHSGGPVWQYIDGNRYILGVNSTSDRVGNAEATRYTTDEETYFTSSSTEDLTTRPPQIFADMGEETYHYEDVLKALWTPVVGRRGLVDFRFNVANFGWYDSGTVTVDFWACYDTNVNPFSCLYLDSLAFGGAFGPNTYGTYDWEVRLPDYVTPYPSYYVGWTISASNLEYWAGDYCGGWRTPCNNYGVIDAFLTVTNDSGFNWTVTSGSGAHGSISPSGAQLIEDGLTTTFSLLPDPGYAVSAVGGSCGGTLSGTLFTTAPVHADCTVDVTFAPADVIFEDGFD